MKKDLPQWLQTLWEISPMLARTAENDYINLKEQLSIGSVSQQRELLLDFADYSERDKTSQTTDECVDNYLDSIK